MLQVLALHLALLQLNDDVNGLGEGHRLVANLVEVHAVREEDRPLENVVEERLHDLVLASVNQLIVEVEVALLTDALQLHGYLLFEDAQRITAEAADDRRADVGNVLSLLVGAHAATDTVARFEDEDFKAEELKLASSSKASNASTENNDLGPLAGASHRRLLLMADLKDAKVDVRVTLKEGVDATEKADVTS